MWLNYLLLALVSYLIGAVPYSLIFSKLFSKVDVRETGTKNLGATNALISAGLQAGFLTLVFDVAKGFGVVFLAQVWLGSPLAMAIAGLMVVAGHDFPFYLRFKGGKGVATTGGVFLAISPLTVIICIAVWGLLVLISRVYILSSVLTILIVLPIALIVRRFDWLIILMALTAGLFSVCQHRWDLMRLTSTASRVDGASPELCRRETAARKA